MKFSQTDRVIAAARSYRGVTQVDFLLPDVVDGLAPITRLAARLHEASEAGYSFECLGRRDKCKVWRLLGEPEGVEGRVMGAGNGSTSKSSVRAATPAALTADYATGQPDTLFPAEHQPTPHWKA